MKQLRSTFLISLIGFIISYTPLAKAQDAMGMSVASCLSLPAMKAIAKADAVSLQQATELLNAFIVKGVCGRYMPPRLLPLDQLVLTYKDVNKVEVELWKIKGFNMWSLFEKQKVLKVQPPKVKSIGV